MTKSLFRFTNPRHSDQRPLRVGDLVVHEKSGIRRAEKNETFDGQIIEASGGMVRVVFTAGTCENAVSAGSAISGDSKVKSMPMEDAKTVMFSCNASIPGAAFGPFQAIGPDSAGFVEVRATSMRSVCCLAPGGILHVHVPTAINETAHMPFYYLDLPYPPTQKDVTDGVDRVFESLVSAIAALPFLRKTWNTSKVTGRDWLEAYGRTHVLFSNTPLPNHHHLEDLPFPIGINKKSVTRIVAHPCVVLGAVENIGLDGCLLPILLLVKLGEDSLVRVADSVRFDLLESGFSGIELE